MLLLCVAGDEIAPKLVTLPDANSDAKGLRSRRELILILRMFACEFMVMQAIPTSSANVGTRWMFQEHGHSQLPKHGQLSGPTGQAPPLMPLPPPPKIYAGSSVLYTPRPCVAAKRSPLFQKSSSTETLAGPPCGNIQVAPASSDAKIPTSVPT